MTSGVTMKRFDRAYLNLIVPILAFAVFFTGWFLYVSEDRRQETVSQVVSDIKEISVVLDRSYPPYIFSNEDGEPQGILVDQWNLWEKKTGVKVHLYPMAWADALKGMSEGKYDVIDTIFRNPQRELMYDFTEAYADIEVPIFFHRNISGVNSAKDLKGFTVAAKEGDNAVDVLKAAGVTSIRLYKSEEALIKAAKDGDVVVFVLDKPPALYYLYKFGMQDEFQYSTSLYTGSFRRAVAKGDQKVFNLLQQGFSSINATDYKAINEKWMGTNQPINKNVMRYVFVGIVLVMFILFFLAYWNISLKSSVERKTRELSDALRKLELSNSKVSGIIHSIPDLVFVLDRNGVYLDFLSETREKSLYLKKEFFIGKSLTEVMPPYLAMEGMKRIERLFDTGEIQILEYDLEINGATGYFESRFVLLEEDLVLCIIRDTTERRKSQDLLYEMSTHDFPTGLYNRNFFEAELKRIQETPREDIGIVVCDIDGLKLVNDTLGHSEGDNYLKTVSKLLLDIFPENSVVSRIGGDEFAVICQGLSTSDVLELKNKITESIECINGEGRLVPISLSVGYSLMSKKHQSLDEVFKEADDFMYREKLHHRQSVRSNYIDLLNKMLEARDYITEGHGERMRDYCVKLAQKRGLPGECIKDMKLFAQFHDIGKIGVADRILFKPGPLDEEEWIEMKRHAEIGYRIAESSPDLRHISEWIFKHHEWWDGSGYPFGAKGVDIPIQCRILCIVDAYDAMTNDRPYRKALDFDTAVRELKISAGMQFDPELLEDFIEILKDERTNSEEKK